MTTSSITQRLTILSLIFMIFGPSRVLYAMPRGDGGIGVDAAPSLRRLASVSVPVILRIEGELIQDTNSGALTLKDNRTGKTYQLTGKNESAQKIFENGTRSVAVEGTLTNENTLNVQTTQAL